MSRSSNPATPGKSGTAGKSGAPSRPRWMRAADFDDLAASVRALERPGFSARLMNRIGQPAERAAEFLSPRSKRLVERAVEISLQRALRVAVHTLNHDGRPPRNHAHRLAVGATGAAGGAFGPVAAAAELPVTTAIMMRSIAEIAGNQGEDLRDPQALAECLKVFAMGGDAARADADESGYYHVRAMLSGLSGSAVQSAAARGAGRQIQSMLAAIGQRYGVQVSHSFAAKAMPAVGAVGGGAVNFIFMRHFQTTARAHFTMRRLERDYGADRIRPLYEAIRRNPPEPAIDRVAGAGHSHRRGGRLPRIEWGAIRRRMPRMPRMPRFPRLPRMPRTPRGSRSRRPDAAPPGAERATPRP